MGGTIFIHLPRIEGGLSTGCQEMEKEEMPRVSGEKATPIFITLRERASHCREYCLELICASAFSESSPSLNSNT